MTKSILVLHTAHFLLSDANKELKNSLFLTSLDAKHLSACQGNFDVQFYLRFLYTRFPHLRCLHADSITRAIHMMYFTRCFHYLRNPYLQNDHYPQFHYTRIKSPLLNGTSAHNVNMMCIS